MDRSLIQGFYITPSARAVLGTACLDGAFNWERTNPGLKRLTFGELDMDQLDEWEQDCFKSTVEPLLVLGPEDMTPTAEQYPEIVGISILSAHVIDSPDMQALRGILHEPDELFTTTWGDFAGGYRWWFLPPGPVAVDGNVFWPIYREALKQYAGPILGIPGTEFVRSIRDANWCPIKRNDLTLSGFLTNAGRTVRLHMRRFPFNALNFDTRSRAWSSEGWLPDDLERIDPGGKVRQACEEEFRLSANK